MARITVEDCLQKVNNRFSLIHMASKRVRQLRKGAEATLSSKNSDIVLALREIAAGNVVIAQNDQAGLLPPDEIDLLPEELPDQTDQIDQPEEELIEEQDAKDTEAK